MSAKPICQGEEAGDKLNYDTLIAMFMKLSTRHVTEDVRSLTTIADRINARDSLSLNI